MIFVCIYQLLFVLIIIPTERLVQQCTTLPLSMRIVFVMLSHVSLFSPWSAYLVASVLRGECIPHICHFFTLAKVLENKIYTEKTRKLRQNTQKIANFLRYYGKIHSKLPIFRVKFVKIYTGQKKFTRVCPWRPWQISGMT